MAAGRRGFAWRRRTGDRPPRGDEGFGLTELLVAMFLFAGISTATVSAMITSLQTIHENNQRVQSANVARTQVQALRAMDVASIPLGLSTSLPIPVGVPEGTTIETTAEWVGLGQSASACRDASPGQAYLRVHVEATRPGDSTTSRIDTILTPRNLPSDPGTGAVTIEVIDQNGEPVSSVQVAADDLAHPENRFLYTTGADGCLFIPGLTAPAMLELTAERPGFVSSTPTGSQDAVQLDPDTLSRSTIRLAAASSILFDSVLPDYPLPNGLPVVWQVNETGATVHTSAVGDTVTDLWPTTSGVTAWLGDCSDADPQVHGRQRQSFDLRAGEATRALLGAQPIDITGLADGVAVSVRHVGAGCADGPFSLGVANAKGKLRAALPFGSWVFTASDDAISEDSQPKLLMPPGQGEPISVEQVEFESWTGLLFCPAESDHPEIELGHPYDPLIDEATCYDEVPQP